MFVCVHINYFVGSPLAGCCCSIVAAAAPVSLLVHSVSVSRMLQTGSDFDTMLLLLVCLILSPPLRTSSGFVMKGL